MAKPNPASKLRNVVCQFPPKVMPLFQPCRWKVMYGGRGSGKSWSAARALLIIGQQKPTRILCCREFMASLADSVHQLLVDQIRELGMEDFYTIERKSIYSATGTTFRFGGLKTNPSMIRSFENVNIAWVEEASGVSKTSWDILSPTIRAPDSEIWVTFNPDLETDSTFTRFIVNPPSNAWIEKLNYVDNPWFPNVLRHEMEELKKNNYEDYLHIWEGETRKYYDGAVYLEQLRNCEADKRITRVRYDPVAQVEAVFDIGWADSTAIWLVQRVAGGETHLIDYYENHRKPLDHYLKWLTDHDFPISTIWLPRDAKAKNLGSGKSVEELTRAKGFTVRIVPNLSISDGINALRTVFPTLWIDKDKCSDGIQALQHYRYEVIDDGAGGFKNSPVHDRWSHGCLTADALVKTDRGEIPISEVTTDHLAWTPAGYAKITYAGVVKQADKLIELELSNGKTLICTPEHKIFTNRGLVVADAIRYSDRILSGNELQCRVINLLSMATHTGYRATITGEINGEHQGNRATSIERFGNTITALYQMATTSIIRTVTPLITIFPTSILCPNTITSHSTPDSLLPMALSSLHPTIAWSKQPYGTEQTKAESGIASTPKTVGKTGHGFRAFVKTVVKNIARLILTVPNGATSTVKWKRCVNVEATTLVYDLTVENHGCYQANGILVSNSDAARYVAVAIKAPKRRSANDDEDVQTRHYRPVGHATSWMGL